MQVIRVGVISLASVCIVVACTASGTGSGAGASDAGADGSSDALVEAAATKDCVTPADMKIVSRPSANASAPDDQDCDVSDPNSIEQCKFGRCAGWTDPLDGTPHGKCIATCVQMNKNPGDVCFPGAVCKSFANTAYCLPTVVPFCSADGGARPGDGGCMNRGAACTYDDDCCSNVCTPNTTGSGAKCE